jgi:predicted aspartyl protease
LQIAAKSTDRYQIIKVQNAIVALLLKRFWPEDPKMIYPMMSNLLLLKSLPMVAICVFASTAKGENQVKFSTGVRVLIPCRFDDHGGTCILDTGSYTSLLPSKAWVKKMPAIGSRDSVSGSTSEKCDLVRISSISIGDFSPKTVDATRCSTLAGDFSGGVIGMDVLKDRSVSFDFTKGSLTEDPGSDSVDGEDSITRDSDGHIFVPAKFNDRKISVLWDTGIPQDGMVDEAFVRSNSDHFKLIKTMKSGSALGGTYKAKVYETSSLIIGGKTFKLQLIAVDFSKMPISEEKIPIFLGLNAIKNANWRFDLNRQVWSFL